MKDRVTCSVHDNQTSVYMSAKARMFTRLKPTHVHSMISDVRLCLQELRSLCLAEKHSVSNEFTHVWADAIKYDPVRREVANCDSGFVIGCMSFNAGQRSWITRSVNKVMRLIQYNSVLTFKLQIEFVAFKIVPLGGYTPPETLFPLFVATLLVANRNRF